VNPTIKSQGYGTSILHHLIGEAAILASHRHCHDILFLDVYTTSIKAIKLYEESGFMKITDEPILDPLEPGMAYLVMAKRVS
jgi:ribosomal protein S18 acetylase RimI-like enzyme